MKQDQNEAVSRCHTIVLHLNDECWVSLIKLPVRESTYVGVGRHVERRQVEPSDFSRLQDIREGYYYQHK